MKTSKVLMRNEEKHTKQVIANRKQSLKNNQHVALVPQKRSMQKKKYNAMEIKKN